MLLSTPATRNCFAGQQDVDNGSRDVWGIGLRAGDENFFRRVYFDDGFAIQTLKFFAQRIEKRPQGDMHFKLGRGYIDEAGSGSIVRSHFFLSTCIGAGEKPGLGWLTFVSSFGVAPKHKTYRRRHRDG